MAVSTLTEVELCLSHAKVRCETGVSCLVKAAESLAVAFFKAEWPHLVQMHLADAKGHLREVAEIVQEVLAAAEQAAAEMEATKDAAGTDNAGQEA